MKKRMDSRLWISKAPKCFLELEKYLTMKIYISAIITVFGNKELAWGEVGWKMIGGQLSNSVC